MKKLIQFSIRATDAPLGDPVEIKVCGYNLTLRKSEAEQIWVKANS